MFHAVYNFLEEEFANEILKWIEESHKTTAEETSLKVDSHLFYLCMTSLLAERIGTEMEAVGFPRSSEECQEKHYLFDELGGIFAEMIEMGWEQVNFIDLANSLLHDHYLEFLEKESESTIDSASLT
jgi:hypothetical protein